MSHKFTVVIEQDGNTFTAHCLEVDVISQGKSPGAALDNIREAIKLFIDDNPKFKSKQINVAIVEV